MATCKDCLSYEVCKQFNVYIPENLMDIEKHCEGFKNKATFVEVVRCKDCKKFIEKGDEFLLNDVYGFCEKSRIGFFDDGEEVYGNGFCSDGERK